MPAQGRTLTPHCAQERSSRVSHLGGPTVCWLSVESLCLREAAVSLVTRGCLSGHMAAQFLDQVALKVSQRGSTVLYLPTPLPIWLLF